MPNAQLPTWPGSPYPSLAQRARGDAGTNSGQEAVAAELVSSPFASPRRMCSWAHRACFGLLATYLGACGPSYPESEYPTAPPAGVSPSTDDFAPAPPGALWRRDVDQVVDAGLGKFLQRAELRAQLHEGTFVGFRLLELRPPAWWQGVDLMPGDVITRVNGMPIEQPTDAHAAFESLRTSNKLVVSYLRDGAPRELSYSIIEKPITKK